MLARATAAAFLVATVGCSSEPSYTEVPVLEGALGVGFDDLRFPPSLGKVVVPGGRTGFVFMIDPATLELDAVGDFSATTAYDGSASAGPTSADEGGGYLFVTDRSSASLDVVDVAAHAIAGRSALSSPPGYVRYVEPRREVWVTLPGEAMIRAFSLSGFAPPKVGASTAITLPGAPVSLAIDEQRSRAYANLALGDTVVIDIAKHAIVTKVANGCADPRGLAVVPSTGALVVACAEGHVTLVGDTGVVADVPAGSDLSAIAFDVARSHVLVPSAGDALLSIFALDSIGGRSPNGTLAIGPSLTLLGAFDVPPGARCVTNDDRGGVWVCDPVDGQLVRLMDDFPP